MDDAIPNPTPKKSTRTPRWYRGFLEAMRNSGNVRAACRAADVNRATAYEAKRSDALFAAAWEEALEEATELLEGVAWQRATRAADPSDTLLIFLLKAHKPAKYRETINQNVNQTGTLKIEVEYIDTPPADPTALT